jgi:hypothetical protein
MTNGASPSIPMPADPGPFSMRFPGWTDFQGWASAAAYSTILCADVDGDGQAEIMGVLGTSLQTWHFDATLGQSYRLADADLSAVSSVFANLQVFDLDGEARRSSC